jgi:hypothetical protein
VHHGLTHPFIIPTMQHLPAIRSMGEWSDLWRLFVVLIKYFVRSSIGASLSVAVVVALLLLHNWNVYNFIMIKIFGINFCDVYKFLWTQHIMSNSSFHAVFLNFWFSSALYTIRLFPCLTSNNYLHHQAVFFYLSSHSSLSVWFDGFVVEKMWREQETSIIRQSYEGKRKDFG